jgi:hypothetical protein
MVGSFIWRALLQTTKQFIVISAKHCIHNTIAHLFAAKLGSTDALNRPFLGYLYFELALLI